MRQNIKLVIETIKTRVPIEELIGRYVELKQKGSQLVGCCPFHDDKKPSMYVYVDRQIFKCFVCQAGGDVVTFLQRFKHYSVIETLKELTVQYHIPIDWDERQPQDPVRLARVNQVEQDYFKTTAQVSLLYQRALHQSSDAAGARTYLQTREIDSKIASMFELGWADGERTALESTLSLSEARLIDWGIFVQGKHRAYPRFRQRVIYPIHDLKGRVVGFGGRTIDSAQQPKYLNSAENPFFKKNQVLYGLRQVTKSKYRRDRILLVEGYMDVIALWQAGVDYSVATLGTAFTQGHIDLLKRHTHQIYLCFDGDMAGKRAKESALRVLLPHLDDQFFAYFVDIPMGHDPDSLVKTEGQAAFEKRLDQAVSTSDYLLHHVAGSITQASNFEDKTRYKNALMPLIKEIQHQALKDHLEQSIKNQMGYRAFVNQEKIKPKIASYSDLIAKIEMAYSLGAMVLQAPNEVHARSFEPSDWMAFESRLTADEQILLDLIGYIKIQAQAPSLNKMLGFLQSKGNAGHSFSEKCLQFQGQATLDWDKSWQLWLKKCKKRPAPR